MASVRQRQEPLHETCPLLHLPINVLTPFLEGDATTGGNVNLVSTRLRGHIHMRLQNIKEQVASLPCSEPFQRQIVLRGSLTIRHVGDLESRFGQGRQAASILSSLLILALLCLAFRFPPEVGRPDFLLFALGLASFGSFSLAPELMQLGFSLVMRSLARHGLGMALAYPLCNSTLKHGDSEIRRFGDRLWQEGLNLPKAWGS